MDKLDKKNFGIKRVNIFLLLGIIVLNLKSYSCKLGGVSPVSYTGHVGKDFNITCWFNPEEITSCEHSSNLTFVYSKNSNNVEVPQEDIAIVNDTTIIYTLRNPELMARKYTCKCRVPSIQYSAIDISSIKIGTAPQPVNNFKCFSYDFVYFYCNFTAPYNPAYVNYNLDFIVSEYYEEKINGTKTLIEYYQEYVRTCNLTAITVDNRIVQYCNMTIEDNLYSRVHEWYTFNLTASNTFATKYQRIRINHFDNVIPAKPELTLVNRTSNSLIFQWKYSKWELFYKKKGFEYDLKYLPETGKTEKKDEDFIQYKLNDKSDQILIEKSNSQDGMTIFTLSLDNLKYAYTWYDVRFNVKVRTARNDGTMWSDSFNGTFRTGARRPDSPPKTDIGSYMIDSKSLYLYWEKLPTYRENGANIQYEITSTKRNGKEIDLIPTNKTSNYATYVSLSNDQYEFIIKSVNNVSYSINGSIIRIPKRNEKFKENYLPQRLSKILHYNNYELSWEAPKQSNELFDYTVFWCKSKDEKFTECEDSIHFEHVDKSKRNYTHIKGEHSLNFAVSANYDYYSSGMVWALCTASKDGDFREMDISLSAQKQTILITWMLSCVYLSRIEGYYLTYCPISGSGDNCSEPAKTIVIPKNVDDRYEINNLKPYTSYMVNIRMYSKTVEGPNMTEPKFVTTLELAPSEPRNLRLVNLTSSYAIIEWTVPEYKNGDIRYYEIVYDNKKMQLNKGSFPENATTITYKIELLKSYFNYKVYVTAMTVESSPPSNDVPFRTWMGQPDSVSLRSNQPIATKSGKLITWNRPQEPAGNTSFYEVIVTVKDRSTNLNKDLIVVRSRVPSTNCTIKRFCEDDYDLIGSVDVSVAAVNAIEKEKYDREAFGDAKTFESDDDMIISSIYNHKRKRRSINPEINSLGNLQGHQFVIYSKEQENHQQNDQNEYIKKEYQHNEYDKKIAYNREDYRCAEHIPYDVLMQKYNNHEFFSGPSNIVYPVKCEYKNNNNYLFAKQENIICAVVICVILIAMIVIFVFAVKKVKKMKNIDFVLPPGLADLNQDNNFNNQKIIGGIDMIIPDDLTELSKNPSLESLDKNEKHCLLANSGNDSGFLHGTDYLSDINNSNSDRINDPHDSDNSSTSSDSIEMNDMSNESNNISPSQSPIINIKNDNKNFMGIGEQKQPSIVSNPMIINGYVQHSAIQKQPPQPSMNGYTTLEALGKPTTNLSFNNIPTSTTKTKQDIINSPQTPISNPMISGYVTHKQLSEFGQQSMQ